MNQEIDEKIQQLRDSIEYYESFMYNPEMMDFLYKNQEYIEACKATIKDLSEIKEELKYEEMNDKSEESIKEKE